MQPINVLGAGFSGLATAYFLTKAGRRVRVFEKSDRPGGLIRTVRTEHGLVETAANGILNSARLTAMCADIGVPLLSARREGRRRFIYRGKPKQFPLTAFDIGQVGLGLARNVGRVRPRQFESIQEWGRRILGADTTKYLLAPALGGIYAGDPERLSAGLVFGLALLPRHLHTYRPAKTGVRGTVAPPNGMQQLIDGLYDYLISAGVEFAFNHEADSQTEEPVICCLSAPAAAKYLAVSAPEISERLRGIEMLTLVSATCFFPAGAGSLKAFGCLFPADQGFRSRGVLFNHCIFEGRGLALSETWIFGGALDPEIVKLNDEEIRENILADREKLYGRREDPLAAHITRWPFALPHYSLELEHILTKLPAPPPNIALVGNYLGRIGLAKILERAAYIANQVAKDRP